MNLFQCGRVVLHSGAVSRWKIECDVLTSKDWMGLAAIAIEMLPCFREVEGVPRGGLAFAEAMRPYARPHASMRLPILICDDVCTTGESLERQRGGREAIGIVAFARGPLPAWVRAVWMLGKAVQP